MVAALLRRRVADAPLAAGILVCGIAAMAVLSGLWNVRSSLFGYSEIALPFFTLAFLAACGDAASSIVFYPFMGTFPREELTLFQLGESLTGGVAAVLGAVQSGGTDGTVDDARFAPMWAFLFLAMLLLLSLLGLVVLWRSKLAGGLYEKEETPVTNAMREGEQYLLLNTAAVGGRASDASETDLGLEPDRYPVLPPVLVQLGTAFVENGMLAILPPFATSGKSEQWIVYGMLLIAPPASLLSYLRNLPYHRGGVCVVMLFMAIALLVLATGIKNSAVALPVFILFKGFVTLVKTREFILARLRVEAGLQDAIVFARMGMAIQIGSCVGSVLFFCLTVPSNLIVAAG